MSKKKSPLLSDAQKVAMIHEGGETSRELIRTIGKVADRVVQASITSPYYSVAGITLLSAMMVRGKLISPATSNIVTGTGLTLLGANQIIESIPILSGLAKGEAMIDNEYDSQPVSPWAPVSVEDVKDNYLKTLEV